MSDCSLKSGAIIPLDTHHATAISHLDAVQNYIRFDEVGFGHRRNKDDHALADVKLRTNEH